jgi:alkylation response protein AidB-like acyl-CoA dehydrogenase
VVSTLAETVRGLAPRLAERDAADSERYPAENIADLVAAGVIRAPFPASVGGSGSPLIEAVDAIESIAGRVTVNRVARRDAAGSGGSVFRRPRGRTC